MEKQKPTILYMIRNWNSLPLEKKRTVLTLCLFGVAVLLILIAVIIGISSCACAKTVGRTVEAVPEIPALLQAPADRSVPEATCVPDPVEPGTETDLPALSGPDEPGDGTDEPGDGTDDPGTQESQYQTLKKHDKGEAVSNLQARLMELGYLEIEETTDYFGNSTEYAVSLFQRQHDLKRDGIAGEQTQQLLYSKEAQHYMMIEGSEGRDVKMLQEQLVDYGYLNKSDVDSVYGEKTVEAVKAFQKRNGLSADGKAGEKTLEKLFSEGAKISKELEQKQKEAEKTPKPTKKTTPKPGATAKATKKPTPTPKAETRIDKLIKAANSKIGCEYVLGGRGPKVFDCSGLVYYCLRQAGVSVDRLSAAGYSSYSKWKNITSVGSLQRGDLLFFRSDESSAVSHTGIYIGGGMMIDASSSQGKVVKRALSSYWKRNFVNARRPW